jgi:hypothetical protein
VTSVTTVTITGKRSTTQTGSLTVTP